MAAENVWRKETDMEIIESCFRLFKFSWLIDEIGQRTTIEAFDKFWSKLLRENHESIFFHSDTVATFLLPWTIIFQFSKQRKLMNFDQLALPFHILSDPRCRIGARVKNILNPVLFPRRNLDINSRSDLELESARDEDFSVFFDKFIMRPARHRCTCFVALVNFGITSQNRQMLFSHFNCHAIKKMFGADLALMKINDFLQSSTIL